MAIPGIRGVSKVVHEVNTNKLNLIDAFDSCRMSQIILEMPLECLEGKRMNRKKQIHFVYNRERTCNSLAFKCSYDPQILSQLWI